MLNHRVLAPRPAAIAGILAAALALGGCAGSGAVDLASPPPSGTDRFVSEDYHVVVQYPDTVDAAHAFESDYFLGNRWNPDVARTIPGAALLSLTLPGSNKLRRGVLRLGASDDTRAVDSCGTTPGREDAEAVQVGGVAFTRLDHGDAAMNHFSEVRSYRGVHADQCIAIDLVVTGINAGVYDDPPEAPFSTKQAMRRLEGLLDDVSFID